MPFSNALDGFVKGFSVGAEQVRAAKELQMKQSYYDANAAESDAKAEYYRNKGVPDDGVVPGLMTEGRSMYGANAEVPKFAIPATGETYPVEPINEENDKLGLPSGHLRKTAELESSLDPRKKNPNSSAAGLFQFTKDTAKQYALADPYDPVASTKTAGIKAVEDSKSLTPILGRAPNGPELFLAHNQGPAGAKALLSNPNAKAIAALTPAYKGDANLARQAIIDNGGTPDMTAGQFVQQLQKRYNSQAAISGGSEFASHGGVVGQYADGGVAQKPYYIDDLEKDVSNAFGKLGDVVKGGLEGIEEQFGLKNPPAVPTADPNFMRGVEAYQRNAGRAEPEQVEQVKRTVDPENKLGDAVGTTYGMIKSYEYHLSRGDLASANAAASAFLQYTRYKSSQLGALAYRALENGDETAAAKAIEHAFNIIPNAQKIQMRDGKALVIDQRTGDVIRELKFTPKTMMDAATGLVSGETWLQDLEGSLKPKEVQVAAINAAAKETTANINAGSRENVELHKDVRQDKAINVKVSEGDKNRDLKASEGALNRDLKASEGALNRANTLSKTQLITEARSNDVDKNNAARIKLKEMGIDADASLQEDKQAFKADESAKDRALKVDEGDKNRDLKASEGDKNRGSREGIAAGHDQTLRKNTLDRLTSNEGINLANNQTKLAINSNNIADKEFRQNVNNTFKGEQKDLDRKNAKEISGDKIASQQKIAGDRNQANKEIANTRGANQQSAAATRAIGARNSKELDRLDKMTDHEVLGVDEAITPSVNKDQAQEARNIARSIVEGGNGKIYGDQAADYARFVTTWDAKNGRPKYNVSLSETQDGYSMKLPNGQSVPLTQSGYQTIKSLRDEMAKASR
jgi:hypothetical protein